MKLKEWLVPREERFFDLLSEQAEVVEEGAKALVEMLANYDGAGDTVRAARQKVKDIEHRGDLKTHDIFTILNATFITPLDREDIATLASRMDDILDFTYATANHLHLYEVKRPPPELAEISRLLHAQARLLREALAHLPHPASRKDLREKLVEIHRLENQADDLTNRAKAALFQQDDVKHILKVKDVLEYIETATDKCEDAADVLRDILVKHQ